MTGQNVGYIRVSTLLQNTARQLDGVSLHKVFEDKFGISRETVYSYIKAEETVAAD